MIRIKCPYCGERDHSEFSYGGDASIKYPALDASEAEWTEAIFFRENIKGVQKVNKQNARIAPMVRGRTFNYYA